MGRWFWRWVSYVARVTLALANDKLTAIEIGRLTREGKIEAARIMLDNWRARIAARKKEPL